MGEKRFIVEIEAAEAAAEGKPSLGPVYRSIFAKDGFPELGGGLESCWDVFRMSVEKFPNNYMLGRREIVDGKARKYVWQTYKEVYDTVIKLGNSIRSCGVEEGANCGIYGVNCPEWVMSMEACNAHGLRCVPLYDTLGATAVEFDLCHAEVSIAFVEEKKIPELFKTFPNSIKYLRTIVSFDKVTSQQREEALKFDLALYEWDEFLRLGEGKSYELPRKRKSDICTIMHTSGTTGNPKGLSEKDVHLSYLPLAHIFDRVNVELFIHHGASIGFWMGDVKMLVEDLKELKPTIFISVPRVLDKVYSGLQQKVNASGLFSKMMFNLAYKIKNNNMEKGKMDANAIAICNKIVFDKVKRGLGGRVRLILSGAAPLASHIESFLRVVTCANVIQGYGLTETCAGCFVSLPNETQMVGTVGPPAPNVDIRLQSVPEMGYDALQSNPQGEICIRSKTLFSGYYKREDLTEEVLIDGWFHTGDIGEWQADGSMKIIDRKKNIFKLSQGEYVAVENLETIYSLLPAIDAIWIYGNSFESFLVAVINPNQRHLENWSRENNVDEDYTSLCANPGAKRFILEQLTNLAKEQKLKGFQFIKAVHLDPQPFDMDRGLLTPKYDKKRPQMLKYYQSVIEDMYSNAKQTKSA